jgi:hypothetical protein
MTGVENLASTEFRTPKPPFRSCSYTDYSILDNTLGCSLPNNTVFHELFSRILAHTHYTQF